MIAGLISITYAAPVPAGNVNLNFKTTPLRVVIPEIVRHSKKRLIVDTNMSGTTTLNLVNVPWKKALSAVLNTYDLDYIETENSLIIVSSKNVKSNLGVSSDLNVGPARTNEIKHQPKPKPRQAPVRNTEDLSMNTKEIANILQVQTAMVDDSITAVTQITGITGYAGNRSAIVSYKGANKLWKEGSLIDGEYKVLRIGEDHIKVEELATKKTELIKF